MSAIKIEHISKKYIIGLKQQSNHTSLRDVLTERAHQLYKTLRAPLAGKSEERRQREEFWALKDISMTIDPGERIGIVGRNGAGKSTLLKVLSRITEPTEGRVTLKGRVSSLLEVGTGFHPELTGRENIYLNGAILGMGKREIKRKFDTIVDFAEIEKFLDTPVKRYSSGMYVRLAFAVAAHLESDILIVDEVLAVGDAGFRRKCMGRMESVANEGRTVFFVSHNMGAISEVCSRAVMLERGEKVKEGDVSDIISHYARLSASAASYEVEAKDRSHQACSITNIRVLSAEGTETGVYDINEAVTIDIEYEVYERIHGLQLALNLARNMVDVLHTFNTDDLGPTEWVAPGTYRARHQIPPMFLKGGTYSVSLAIGTSSELMQELVSAVQFEVEENSVNPIDKGFRKERPGVVISPGRWQQDVLLKEGEA